MTIQDAVKAAMTGEPIDPSFLEDDPAGGEELNSRYAEVQRYFAENGPASVRRTAGVDQCSECGGVVLKLESKVPGAVRYDGCCSNCGENEFHRAGWSGDEAGNKARETFRASIGSTEVGS